MEDFRAAGILQESLQPSDFQALWDFTEPEQAPVDVTPIQEAPAPTSDLIYEGYIWSDDATTEPSWARTGAGGAQTAQAVVEHIDDIWNDPDLQNMATFHDDDLDDWNSDDDDEDMVLDTAEAYLRLAQIMEIAVEQWKENDPPSPRAQRRRGITSTQNQSQPNSGMSQSCNEDERKFVHLRV